MIGCLCMSFVACILLQEFLGMSWTYLILLISRRRWSIVHVGTMIFCCSGCCFQYQLVFSCTYQIYCALTTNSPSEITLPSIVKWKFVLCNTNRLYVIFLLRWLQHTFKHYTLLFKCINWDNIINHQVIILHLIHLMACSVLPFFRKHIYFYQPEVIS